MAQEIFKQKKIALGVCAALIQIAQPSIAQENNEGPDTSDDSLQLEVIEVTSQKRVESLQDVPLSVSTVGRERIMDLGITQTEELSEFVPNFTVTKAGQGFNIYMRGIGSGQNQGFEQAVATFVDGVYRGRGVLMRSAFVDVEAAEVLRGPQGTLFGINSTAGAVNLTTRNATDSFEAGFQSTYLTELNKIDFEGYVNGALTETLNARLVVKYEDDDGFIENTASDNQIPSRRSMVARLVLDWNPIEDLNVNLKVQHDTDEVTGRPIVLTAEPSLIASNPPFLTQIGNVSGSYSSAFNSPEFEESDADHVTLSISYELDNHRIEMINGWQSYNLEGSKDQDLTIRPLIENPAFNEEYDQFSSEFRFLSTGDNNINYIIGAYYQTWDLDYTEISNVFPLSLSGDRDFGTDSDLWALFGQLDFSVTDNIDMTLGLRYNNERKYGRKNLLGNQLGTGVPLTDVPLITPPALAQQLGAFGLPGLPGNIYASILGGQFPFLDPLLLGTSTKNLPNPLLGTIEEQRLIARRDESALLPSFTISYDAGKHLYYFTINTGAKAGGFDARSNLPTNFEFEDESVISYEIGSKLTLLNGAAEFNIAAFSMKFEDMQTSTFDGQVGFFVENAGEATSRGIEIDGRYAVTDNLTLAGALGLLDFEWDKFQGAKCFASNVLVPSNIEANGRTCDLSGETNALAPEVTGNLRAEYFYPVSDSLESRTTLEWNYSSEFFTAPDLNPFTEQEAFSKVNLRTAVISEDGWEIALLAKNITDEEITNFSFDVPFSRGVYANFVQPGRHFGLQFRYTYF